MSIRFLILILIPVILFLGCTKTGENNPTSGIVDNPNIKPAGETHITKTTPKVSDYDKTVPIDSVSSTVNRQTIPSERWDLRATMSKKQFESTKGAELEMQLMRPIYGKIFDLDEDASQVMPHLTGGQQALYFFRKMDESLMEGGIENFFKKPLAEQLVGISKSTELFKSESLDQLSKDAAKHYAISRSLKVDGQQDLKSFYQQFNKEYEKKQEDIYNHLEQYIRNHPDEFIKFTD